MTLEYRKSSRTDVRTYLAILVGAVFVWAALSVDPAANCSEDGRECAPWLVPLAGIVGFVVAAGFLAQLMIDFRWGSYLDVAGRRLVWWDTRLHDTQRTLDLDRVARIEVRERREGKDAVCFYDRQDALLPGPHDEALASDTQAWAQEIVLRFPHIALRIVED